MDGSIPGFGWMRVRNIPMASRMTGLMCEDGGEDARLALGLLDSRSKQEYPFSTDRSVGSEYDP